MIDQKQIDTLNDESPTAGIGMRAAARFARRDAQRVKENIAVEIAADKDAKIVCLTAVPEDFNDEADACHGDALERLAALPEEPKSRYPRSAIRSRASQFRGLAVH